LEDDEGNGSNPELDVQAGDSKSEEDKDTYSLMKITPAMEMAGLRIIQP
jgi:hypothetical protein